LDVEVLGLELDHLEKVLSAFGHVSRVGKSFGVLRVQGFHIDFSLPRTDEKMGPGHRGFRIHCNPYLPYAEAAKRRDLTINSMAIDLQTGELLDPHGGQQDLANHILRATDPAQFSDDPLRGLRVMQFAARFNMQPDPELIRLCAALDLSELPSERMWGEFEKLFLKGRVPSLGLTFLWQSEQVRFFPALHDVIPGFCPCDRIAQSLPDDTSIRRALMLAVLFADRNGALTEFLAQLKPSMEVRKQAEVLLAEINAITISDADMRRLARRLHRGHTCIRDWLHVAPVDVTERARMLGILDAPMDDVVLGRHLMARGMKPGPALGAMINRCRDIQDETGLTDVDVIIHESGDPGYS
jgi:tRNA nucleotidyltransferase (CCA-adding enzyme)